MHPIVNVPNDTEWYTFIFFIYFKIYFIDYAITVVPLFLPFIHLCPPLPLASPPHTYFISMGHTYKFFGFYISYTILTLPLSIFHLSFMLHILCTFPPISPSHFPVDNPPCELHFCGSIPVLVVCLVCFCFCLGVVVNNCEFAAILTVHIFYLLFLR